MKYPCTICGTIYELDSKMGRLPSHFPFCSPRCKAIDLGKWLNEEYRISTPLSNLQMMTDEEREVLARFLLDAGEADATIDDDEE